MDPGDFPQLRHIPHRVQRDLRIYRQDVLLPVGGHVVREAKRF
jgi:hypothetical protein